ncbi:MAG: hypothetical protein LAT78_06560 [Roseinatronobacter sp.]|nr:hypothetical protein [Roseinatronobacter sp.]
MFAKVLRLPVLAHGGLVLAAMAAFSLIKQRLDSSYVAARHPVDYAAGQLAFDAQKIEGYYAHMIAEGTLEIYWQTQFIDFAFIAAIMVLSVLLGTFVARLSGPGGYGARLGIGAAVLGVAGAAMDVMENLGSFLMLADPGNIAQPLALIYSSFAALKFALLTLAMAGIGLSILVGLVERLAGAYRPR